MMIATGFPVIDPPRIRRQESGRL
jgi:hypothetical protein